MSNTDCMSTEDQEDVVSYERGQYKWKRNVEKHLIELIEHKKFDNKSIGIIGSWRDQEWIMSKMDELGLKLSYIADNNPNKQDVLKLGIRTCSVESLREIDNLFILVSGMYYAEISQQLKSMGFSEDDDFVVLALEKETQEERKINDKKNQIRYQEDIRKGFDICMKIKAEYGEKPIWLMHQISLGDIYLFSLLLPGIMGVKSVSDCNIVLVVARRTTAHLAKLMGYQNIEFVELEDMTFSLLPLTRLMGEEFNLHNAVFHGTDELFVRLINYTDINFLDSFKRGVFYLNQDVKITYPCFHGRSDVIEKIFYDNKLIPNKTILISPYATHFTPVISKQQWATLVKKLKDKGYTVCTNCVQEEEPIEGTKGIFIDLEDCCDFVEKAGGFIGVRSGLCDLICQTDCRKIVIYDANGNATVDFHGFVTMGIGNHITEVLNDTVHTDELISDIADMF